MRVAKSSSFSARFSNPTAPQVRGGASISIMALRAMANAGTAASAEESGGPIGPLDFSGLSTTLRGTTEYMFRGIANPDGSGHAGNVDRYNNGYRLRVWGSNPEFSDEDIEGDQSSSTPSRPAPGLFHPDGAPGAPSLISASIPRAVYWFAAMALCMSR